MANETMIVAALGGNAISRPDQVGNVEEQFENSRRTAKQLADLYERGYQLVVTHGNGPQIGNFLLRNEAAAAAVYPLPMEVAVAHVQGGMGFMIGQTLTNELASRGEERPVTTIITTVLVDLKDPAFAEPSKPIGREFDESEAIRLREEEGWQLKEVAPGRFRRVVPSPRPLQIMEISTIQRLVEAGELVIACGGGGIPVARKEQYGLCGVRAVIDKDLASALLATQLDTGTFLILTNVECVRLDFGKPGERKIDRMTVAEAEHHLALGQFPAGSMGPKVRGAVEFLKASNWERARAIIGPLDGALDAAEEKTGTVIVKA